MKNDLPESIIILNDQDDLPPPYCYRYKIEITPGDQLAVDFQIEYYDREEVSEEEIEAEGFSENDDFAWRGNLPVTWKLPLQTAIGELKGGESKDNLKIEIMRNGRSQSFHSQDEEQFAYFIQEIIQAIYEKSGRQDEFEFRILKIKKGQKTELNFHISFYNRIAMVNGEQFKWEDTYSLLSDIFSLEFDTFNAEHKRPEKEGIYVTQNDGAWYKADKSLMRVDKKTVIPILENIIQVHS